MGHIGIEGIQNINRQDQKRNTPRHIKIRTLNIRYKERILKASNRSNRSHTK
jgi:hypothetical protein